MVYVPQVSKNKIGRKRKQPFSSSTPANSSGTTNTAGASPSSTPSTPAYSPGETISMPQVPHNASLSKALVVYGYDPQGSPTNPLVSCSMLASLFGEAVAQIFLWQPGVARWIFYL